MFQRIYAHLETLAQRLLWHNQREEKAKANAEAEAEAEVRAAPVNMTTKRKKGKKGKKNAHAVPSQDKPPTAGPSYRAEELTAEPPVLDSDVPAREMLIAASAFLSAALHKEDAQQRTMSWHESRLLCFKVAMHAMILEEAEKDEDMRALVIKKGINTDIKPCSLVRRWHFLALAEFLNSIIRNCHAPKQSHEYEEYMERAVEYESWLRYTVAEESHDEASPIVRKLMQCMHIRLEKWMQEGQPWHSTKYRPLHYFVDNQPDNYYNALCEELVTWWGNKWYLPAPRPKKFVPWEADYALLVDNVVDLPFRNTKHVHAQQLNY